ncbi:MAG TPA: hypothetical protein VNX65_04990, partial [Patescibacteria group bacterium]|nr:hypothetical protein [Patescibacteria group bacterium]
MQDNSLGIKQQVAERIKKANNILITVSANPSVDALSAMLALTLIVNKLDKHGAAVFSGVVPPAINFLKPNKTFENNVDSLRDFIIALDKDKADRLRYKVEDDVVKIFITPYKTTITEKDLQFSQGDFNVDLIIALGVEKRDELDQAIVAHGRILHDAAVITINALDQKSSLGQIDWHEGNVSSLCEMLAGIADVIKPGVLDQQISTALLTGIVAATERFSNQRTAPQVMNVAAQLMVTGANQQLIASNLQGGQLIPSDTPIRLKAPDVDSEQPEVVPAAKKPDGEMQISHVPPTKIEPELPISQPPAALFSDLKQAIADDTKNPDLDRSQNFLDSKPPLVGSKDIATTDAQDNFSKPEAEADYLVDAPSWKGRTIQPPDEPSLGGALSATIDQAEDDKRRSDKADQNKQILTHGGSVSNDRQPPNQSSQPAIKQPK